MMSLQLQPNRSSQGLPDLKKKDDRQVTTTEENAIRVSIFPEPVLVMWAMRHPCVEEAHSGVEDQRRPRKYFSEQKQQIFQRTGYPLDLKQDSENEKRGRRGYREGREDERSQMAAVMRRSGLCWMHRKRDFSRVEGGPCQRVERERKD